MSVQSKSTIKQWFETADKPTQQQFWDWIDSYFHKNELIPIASVDGLAAALNGLPTAQQIAALASITPVIVASNGSATQQIASQKMVQYFIVGKTGNGNFKIGTTEDGSEIFDATMQDGEGETITYNLYLNTDTTFYFTGIGTVKIYTR